MDSTLARPNRAHTRQELAALAFLARYSRGTLELYTIDLKIFYAWCGEHHLDVLADVQRVHLELFARYLENERGNRPTSVARRLLTIRMFYRICVADELLVKSPAEQLRIPRTYRDEARLVHLDRTDMVAMLAKSRASSPADGALIHLMGMLGLRVSEACSLNIEDTVRVERGHRVVRVLGKGLKWRDCPIPDVVARELDRAADGRTAGPLLLRRDGSRMNRQSARRVVERVARRAGVTKPVYPHALRHSFVTNALDAGVPLRDVQIAAGHSDPRMTTRYDRARHNHDRSANYVLETYLAPEPDDPR